MSGHKPGFLPSNAQLICQGISLVSHCPMLLSCQCKPGFSVSYVQLSCWPDFLCSANMSGHKPGFSMSYAEHKPGPMFSFHFSLFFLTVLCSVIISVHKPDFSLSSAQISCQGISLFLAVLC